MEMKWIPVSERLPEEGKVVLATIHLVQNDIISFIEAAYDGNSWPIFWGKTIIARRTKKGWENPAFMDTMKDKNWKQIVPESETMKVVAWMPLPEPYREGE